MGRMINRRRLLAGGIKGSIGFVVLNELQPLSNRVRGSSRAGSAQLSYLKQAYQRLDEYIVRHMEEAGVPGLTLAIANRQGLLRQAQYGVADLKTGKRVGAQTLFEIGSISKSFVAIAILRLAEQGKLDLHKPVSDYLPWLEIESAFPPFTPHHLLSHTAGLSGVPLLNRTVATKLRVGTEPGTAFVYSNIGYVLLGFIIETIEGRPLAESLRAHVLDPLGMTESTPTITNDTRERLAIGYSPMYDDRPFPRKGKLAEAQWIEVTEAAGSIASTAKDMSAYLSFLLNRGVGPRVRILSERSFQLFTQPVIKAPFRGEDASYAYGLWTGENKGHTLLRHTGGMVAFSSAMYADLTEGLGAFASVNARLDGYRPVAVVKYALEVEAALANKRDLPVAPAPTPDQIKNASDYAGTFTAPDGDKLVLSSKGDQLVLEHENRRVILEPLGPDRFIVKDPDFELFVLVFGRDKDTVVEVSHGSRWWSNERYKGARTFSYPREWNAFAGHYRSDSPWYGSVRVVIRKDRLLIDGEQPLHEINPGVFQPEGDTTADRIVFDGVAGGHTTRLNYAGVDFYRAYSR